LLSLRDAGPPGPLSNVYVHVPWCRDRCTYCAFPTAPDNPALHADFVDALCRRAAAQRWPAPLRTLYLGGGTPALLAPEQLGRLIGGIRRCASFEASIEITLEANPANIDVDALASWEHRGITRVSLGVQTFRDEVLHGLARLHSGADARRALGLLASNWRGAWSADLIVGWHGQTAEDLAGDLEQLLTFAPPHVSVYGLTVEPRTPLERLARRGQPVTAARRLHAPFDALWTARLAAAGLERYEVSNFARPGSRSRHNQAYWANADYLGLGPGAASSRDGLRWVEREEPRAWIAAARAGAGVRRMVERVAPAQRLLESVAVGLRTRDGVRVAELERRFGAGWRPRVLPAAQLLLDAGVLRLDETLQLAPAELARADAVARALAAACLADEPDVARTAP
jgi:oxygen-independent coproporphyrinogen-3 oxidase